MILLLLKHPPRVVIWTSLISRRRRKIRSYRWIWYADILMYVIHLY